MIIKQIELNKTEQDAIFDWITKTFKDDCDYAQEYNFPLNECIEVYATLHLYIESSETDSNNQSVILHTGIEKFVIELYHDGSYVKTNDWDIYDRISKYYTF